MPHTILVVEDTDLLRTIYADKLSQDGYEVIAASDGLEALSVLRTQHVDLILLDLIMPRMSGLEALDAIKNDPRTRNIPVLILSNLGQESDVRRGIEMGAADYLIKNEARPADVAEKIAATLEMVSTSGDASNAFKLLIRDHELDSDRFVEHAALIRRFWCPACETELVLELVPKQAETGWYDAHLLCPECGKEY